MLSLSDVGFREMPAKTEEEQTILSVPRTQVQSLFYVFQLRFSTQWWEWPCTQPPTVHLTEILWKYITPCSL